MSAGCGLRLAPAIRRPCPDWLVVGLDLTLTLPPEWEPGETPDWTALDQEGCGDIDPVAILEAGRATALSGSTGLTTPRAAPSCTANGRGWPGN